MLFKTLLKLKEKNGLNDDLINKIDVFFALGKITEAEYNVLMDIPEVSDCPVELEPIEPVEPIEPIEPIM